MKGRANGGIEGGRKRGKGERGEGGRRGVRKCRDSFVH